MLPGVISSTQRRIIDVIPDPDPDPDPEDPYPLPPTNNVLVNLTTYDGSGQTTHPSVVDMGDGGWNGYRWWFADTPYPDGDPQYENPSIWAANDRLIWEIPTGLTNPIDPQPAGGYSSDTDIVWDPDDNRMLVYWREVVDGSVTYHIAESTNGTSWTVHPTPLSLTINSGVNFSPAICRAGVNDWRMWLWHDTNFGLHMHTATDPYGPWTFAGAQTLESGDPLASTPKLRHGDVILDDATGYWFALSNSQPMVSADGLHWIYGKDIGYAAYRASMTPSTLEGYFDTWYANSRRVRYRRDLRTRWTNLIP